MTSREELGSIVESLRKLAPTVHQASNADQFYAVNDRLQMLARRAFGSENSYMKRLEGEQAGLAFGLASAPRSTNGQAPAIQTARSGYLSVMDTMLDELMLMLGNPDTPAVQNSAASQPIVRDDEPNTVFIVHGHDDGMKSEVARLVQRLGLSPCILHEQANRGLTLIEKLLSHAASADFAVVLLSPDDECTSSSPGHRPTFRARQNVILELGLFLGLIGRQRVVALYRDPDRLEIPSDWHGVTFIRYDSAGGWQLELAREIYAAGFAVDLNRLASH